jgi:hypothetical protein
MTSQYLATYLNDHLAGAMGLLELLAYLDSAQAGTDGEQFVAELRADVKADREELETLMRRLRIVKSQPRQAAAWLAEKVAELKLRVDDPANGALRLLAALEAVVIGIEGKRAMWRALAAAAADAPKLQGLDYDRLIQRAEAQRLQVETVRLEVARIALAAT